MIRVYFYHVRFNVIMLLFSYKEIARGGEMVAQRSHFLPQTAVYAPIKAKRERKGRKRRTVSANVASAQSVFRPTLAKETYSSKELAGY